MEAVRAAAVDWGVMHIAGHGIPAELMDRLRVAGTTFFALPVQDKEAYANDPAAGHLQGYSSRLAANAYGQREWEDYLFHLVHPDGLADHALWPAYPPDYIAATHGFGRRTRELASTLLAILSMGLVNTRDRGNQKRWNAARCIGEEEQRRGVCVSDFRLISCDSFPITRWAPYIHLLDQPTTHALAKPQ
ncbi:Leucoanthocyanidin dioxygenase [Zea mays]|uniref:Leucoanthocyanidin dioxygenase n=1 Tax=Zea mays TaxID=4577 RepID=A0A3L6FFR5_MAIZE|nr:Leucoanthocyanidin dioxygenase [Zea mays]